MDVTDTSEAQDTSAETLAANRTVEQPTDEFPTPERLAKEQIDGHAQQYSPRQRGLHWIVAALVVLQLVVGVTIGTLDQTRQNDTAIQGLLTLHLITGTIIFAAMVVRLRLRRELGAPPPPNGTPIDAAVLARTNHLGFYVLLLVLPVLGWLAYLTHGRAAVMWGALHGGLALTLFLAICAHLSGVVYHTYIRRDGLLHRMTG
jgi:cytochrome b561